MPKKQTPVTVVWKKNLPLTVAKISLALVATGSFAIAFGQEKIQEISLASNPCLDQFYKETPPQLQKDSLKKDSYPLCFNGFNVLYSGISKTPLWVAESLTPERLSQKLKRQDSFHEEDRVAFKHRALLSDYRGSGYDRGHMAPNADMSNKAAQHDSFSLANMVPQTPQNNQQVWRELEEATRAIVTKQKHDVYVLTGPEYSGNKIKTIGKSKLMVPTATYKAIYVPKTGAIGAYYVSNDMNVAKPQVELISVCELEEKLGINLFPQLTEEQKRNLYNLPLKATQVKANGKIEYKSWDAKSQCAVAVSKADTKALQKQFQPDDDYATANQTETVTEKSQPAENTQTAAPTETSGVMKVILELLQFLMQLLK